MEGKQEGGLSLVPGAFTVTIDHSSSKVVPVSNRQVDVEGVRHDIDFVSLGNGSFSLILDGRTFIVEKIRQKSTDSVGFYEEGELGHTANLSVNGTQFQVRIDDDRSLLAQSLVKRPQSQIGIQIVRAPMPGLISRIEVQLGEEVTSGKGLLVLEAMKMENEIRSPKHGRVQSIHVEKGKPVEKGEPLVTIAEL